MELHRYNPTIREKFGVYLDGRPNFRIARRMLEKRIVNLDESSDPFWKPKVEEVPKYSYIPDEVWILERLLMGMSNTELPDAEKGTYEPVYVFWHDTSGPKDFSPKEPIWEAVEFLINVCVLGPKQTKAMMEEQKLKERQSQRNLAYDVIDNAAPYLPGKLHDGSGIVVPSGYKK